MIERFSSFAYHANGFLLMLGLIVVALMIVWGALVFGRRILGKVWWIIGELLQRWRK